MSLLTRRMAMLTFAAFAFAYFFAALLRAITATLSPVLTREFSLNARDLGLLAGGYFLGFAVMQLSLGQWLDRHGPKRVILCFLSVAVLGCLLFASATSFVGLMLARVLCGVGLGACLMAPLTGYRRWFNAETQLRANSWMLMIAASGMVASTLPVQWLVPVFGWRPLFWLLALALLLAMVVIAWAVPVWDLATSAPGQAADQGYREVWRHPYFRSLVPLGFVNYGGMIAMQTLWVGPWMVKVAGYTPVQSAGGLFGINLAMLVTFWCWGMVNPMLVRRGWGPERLMARGLPLSLTVLAVLVLLGGDAGALAWSCFFVSCSVVSLAQPAVGLSFPTALAGRALSAFNLVIFAGVFTVQWGIGLLIDGFGAAGLGETTAFRAALTVFWGLSVASYVYFLWARRRIALQPLPT